VIDYARMQPAAGAVFSISMLVGAGAGDCYSPRKVTHMLNDTVVPEKSPVVDLRGN